MSTNKFKVGTLYSSLTINKFADDNYHIVCVYGQTNGGTKAIHLQSKDKDIWFVLDKTSGYTGGNNFNYKCVYNE